MSHVIGFIMVYMRLLYAIFSAICYRLCDGICNRPYCDIILCNQLWNAFYYIMAYVIDYIMACVSSEYEHISWSAIWWLMSHKSKVPSSSPTSREHSSETDKLCTLVKS